MKALDILYGFDETCFVDMYLNDKKTFLSLESQIVDSLKKYITVEKLANVIVYAEQIGTTSDEIWSVLLYIADQLPKEKLHAYEDVLYGYCSKQVIPYKIAQPYLNKDKNLYQLDNVLLCIQGSKKPMDILVSRLASNYFEEYLFQCFYSQNINWIMSDEFYQNMLYYNQKVSNLKNVSYVESKLSLNIVSKLGYTPDYLLNKNYDIIIDKLSRFFNLNNLSLQLYSTLFSQNKQMSTVHNYTNKNDFLVDFEQLKKEYDK